ncbi:Rz1-like lysis system protein LysC [Actinobacillus porcinus]|uniref:Rz1-like lysis system protein LysC n=1 Tax=Actinobacillus porcinus TaxID=51048 RepID=UPI003B5C3E64
MFLKTINVLTLLCLTMLLSSCASQVTTKTAYLYPPQAFLIPCAKTAFTGSTYGDVVEHLIRVTSERDICAGQIDNIREWQNKNQVPIKP